MEMPPPPPAEVAFVPVAPSELGAPVVVDMASLPQDTEAVPTAQDTLPQPEVAEARLSRGQKIGKKIIQIAKNESLGTTLDVVTTAIGVPIPVREVAGSTLDSALYAQNSGKSAEAAERPSRIGRVGRVIGKVALFASAGMIAQRFGSEAVDMISDRLSGGVTGQYITPGLSKFGALTGVNAAIGRFAR